MGRLGGLPGGESGVAAFLSGAIVVGWVAGATAATAANLDEASERWLRQVHLLILPDEEALFRGLRAEDRKEFQKIFWARRDPAGEARGGAAQPSPAGTPRIAMEETFVKARGRADDLFGSSSERGSQTGCGQVYLLLGEPLEVQGRELKVRFDSLREMREGARRPEVWTYRSRAGDAVEFTGGELQISFDEACRFAEGGRVLEDLRRVAEARITRPDLGYRTTTAGRLVPLDELLRSADRTPSPASSRALLASDRSDFLLSAESKLLLRTRAGLAYAAGLVRFDARAPSGTGNPASSLAGRVAVQALATDGSTGGFGERTFTATPEPDGTAVASYGLALAPGQYTLRIGVLLSAGKASVTSLPLEVPDFDAPGLNASPLVVYPEKPPGPADAQDPYGALVVGSLRLRPRFGNVFRATDALQVVAVLTGGQPDPSGKGGLRARFLVFKDGSPVAKGDDQLFDTAMAVASVGPIPLAGFAPGQYVVKLEVTDSLAGKTLTRSASFEIRE